MTDKGLVGAIGASLLVHGLVLGVGGSVRAPLPQPPRVLEARLVKEEAPPAKRALPPLAPAHAAAPPVHAEAPLRPPLVRAAPAAHPPELVHGQSAMLPAVALSAAVPGPVVAAPAVAAPSAPSLAAAPAASGPSYAPPSFGASYLDNPKPVYPLMARRRGLEGTVRLDVRVSAEGIPIAVKLKESAGHETLDEAAIVAVWHWRFAPARRGGEAVEASVVVPVRFRLGGDEAG